MLSHIFNDVVWKHDAAWSCSVSTCAWLTMKPFQNTFLWRLRPEETSRRPTLTSSLSQVIALQLVILVLSSVTQEQHKHFGPKSLEGFMPAMNKNQKSTSDAKGLLLERNWQVGIICSSRTYHTVHRWGDVVQEPETLFKNFWRILTRGKFFSQSQTPLRFAVISKIIFKVILSISCVYHTLLNTALAVFFLGPGGSPHCTLAGWIQQCLASCSSGEQPPRARPTLPGRLGTTVQQAPCFALQAILHCFLYRWAEKISMKVYRS